METWYEDRGEGEPLVLLHPGMADARAFGPNLDDLASRFHVYTPERRGHGHMPNLPGPISYGLLVEKPALCNRIDLDFLTTDPVSQMAPIRRA
jgi:pimeloyl-ACP methyl ester carboxylesterase